MPGPYGGNVPYGSGNYSAGEVYDSSSLIAAAFGGNAAAMVIRNAASVVLIDMDVEAVGGVLRNASADVALTFGGSATAFVAHEKRGQATVVSSFALSARATAVLSGESQIDLSFMILMNPYIGPFWAVEIIDGNWDAQEGCPVNLWVKDNTSGVWTPKNSCSPGVWVTDTPSDGGWN